jgi:protoheme IX farnesyltransferase
VNAFRASVRSYYELTKPGIIYGNAMTAVAGFLLAARGHFSLGLFVSTIAGISLIIASACVFNNYIDRNIDQKMSRTKKRALVTGRISGRNALLFASLLCLAGFGILSMTNLLTVLLGVIAIGMYVVVYGIAKRRSVYGTIVGSIPGALPPVAGYTAVINSFDTGAWLLFFSLVLWQMPHFYAIAMYRRDEYAAANIPVLSVKQGMKVSKLQIMIYIIAFTVVTSLLTVTGYTGVSFLVAIFGIGAVWFGTGVSMWHKADDTKWARRMFFISLLVIVILSFMLAVDVILP